MLYLLFQIGRDRYAIRTDQVVEVLPLVTWKAIPPACSGVAGIFNYHGAPVPLIDLGELATQKPSRKRLSTRIILVNYLKAVEEGNAESHLLGLLAEEATTTLRRAEEEFADSGVAVESAPYLGPVTTDDRGIIQRVEVNQLLPADVQQMLFTQPLEPF